MIIFKQFLRPAALEMKSSPNQFSFQLHVNINKTLLSYEK